MTVLGNMNVFRKMYDGDSDACAAYALRNVFAGDTVDVGLGGLRDFLSVNQAIVMGSTVALATVAAINGTVLTMPAGLGVSGKGDAGYLFVLGSSASQTGGG
jgi:hypothetical protein